MSIFPKKKTIILDLDETLVHTFSSTTGFDSASKNPNLKNRIFSFTLDGEFMWGFIRPFAHDFISLLQKYYNIGVWSAGLRDYVEKIVSILFVQPPVFVWSREDCEDVYLPSENQVVKKKPLTKLYNHFPCLNRTNSLIIDDRDDVCDENTSNHIHIPSYELNQKKIDHNHKDDSLECLCKYLLDLVNVRDVRSMSGFDFYSS